MYFPMLHIRHVKKHNPWLLEIDIQVIQLYIIAKPLKHPIYSWVE